MSKLWLIGTGLVIGLALAIGGSLLFFDRTYQFQGAVIDPPAQAADFTLTDQNGTPFSLSEQRGKIVLIFFGYTHCPDVCPITLTEFNRIKKQLGPQAGEVAFVFVTVDPERDTPEHMKAYIDNFDPGFVGLSGSQSDLEPVWRAYGVYQQKQDQGSAAGYLVDHTSRMYLVDAQGRWRINYPFGMETDKIVADLRHLLGKEDAGG